MADKKKKEEQKEQSVWNTYTAKEKKALEKLNEGYKAFLSKCKTERESTTEAIAQAEAKGYRNLEDIIKNNGGLKPGDKVYAVCMNKAVALFNIGTRSLEEGMAILGAHIDTCRLDLKQHPVYEAGGMAYFDTHYYGGIKKYQWVTLPLALHGVVVKKDGTKINIVIGEDAGDPVFCVTDLLIHLAQEQMEKKAGKVVEGENLDILIGSYPLKDTDKDAVKAGVLQLLEDKYGITEDDFISAERTSCCLLVDKEEIGSVGATGMQSRFFENTVAEILHALGGYSGLSTRRCLANSWMLSSDVSSAFDNLYASVYDKNNCAYLGKGMVFMKFTGARGKSGSNDASAEYLGRIRQIMDKHKVKFQTAELGKVDHGGGGTIAYIMSLYGMNVIDSGVGVLSMHAPWEAVSKIDVYETTKGYKAFLKEI